MDFLILTSQSWKLWSVIFLTTLNRLQQGSTDHRIWFALCFPRNQIISLTGCKCTLVVIEFMGNMDEGRSFLIKHIKEKNILHEGYINYKNIFSFNTVLWITRMDNKRTKTQYQSFLSLLHYLISPHEGRKTNDIIMHVSLNILFNVIQRTYILCKSRSIVFLSVSGWMLGCWEILRWHNFNT